MQERLLQSGAERDERLLERRAEVAAAETAPCTFRPQITAQGSAFQRDKPLLESIVIAKSQADQRRAAKIHQRDLREAEEGRKPLIRPAAARSDALVRASKYADLAPEDRLLSCQADALEKYSGRRPGALEASETPETL